MKNLLYPFKRFVLLFLVLIAFSTLFRIIFYCCNASAFQGLSAALAWRIALQGIRFDISSLMVLNSLFLLLSTFPWWPQQHKIAQRILLVVFMLTNVIPWLFEISDWIYYKFNHKRSTFEVFQLVSSKGDFLNLLPQFAKDYWYLFLTAIVVVILLYKIYSGIQLRCAHQAAQSTYLPKVKYYVFSTALFVLFGGLAVLGIRGGTQFIPIGIRNAVAVAPAQYSALVLNTPFSLINSFQSAHLEPVHYMAEDEAEAIIHPIKDYSNKGTFQKRNVVILVFESLSRSFTMLGNDTVSYTPFLDSLMRQSITFTNAFANGLRSNEGLPALLAGVPSLMEESIITSVYGTNRLTAFPQLLKPLGYYSVFYHGCTNGTMSFDVMAKSTGFDAYYGRTEYNNEADFDGNWGIYDEPFLQYFAQGLQKLGQGSQPFLATVFTATSHHPFHLPVQYKNVFPKGTMLPHETVGYTDYAIRQFFSRIQKEPWFKNTLFILSADHASPYADAPYDQSAIGRRAIPIFLFDPQAVNQHRMDSTLVQQIDVLPTIMDYMHYPHSFYALGNSAFDTGVEQRFVVNKINSVGEWLTKDWYLKWNDTELIEVYKLSKGADPLENVITQKASDSSVLKETHRWKALVQIYTNSLIDNKMYYAPK